MRMQSERKKRETQWKKGNSWVNEPKEQKLVLEILLAQAKR